MPGKRHNLHPRGHVMKPEEWRKAATERAKAQVRERTVGNYGSVLQTFRIAFDAVGLDGNLTQGKVVSAMEYLIAHGYTYVILNSIRAAIGWKSRQPGCRKWRAGLGDKVDGYIAGVARTVGTAPLQEATGVEEADLNAIATKYLDLKGTLPGRKITTMVCSFYLRAQRRYAPHHAGVHFGTAAGPDQDGETPRQV
jgi:hypothetical protein